MKSFIISAVTAIAILCAYPAQAQVKSGTTKLDKTARKGSYAGVFKLKNQHVAVFYFGKDGLYAYEYDHDANFVAEHHGKQAENLLEQTSYENYSNKGLENIPELKEDVITYYKSLFGGDRLKRNHLYVKSDEKFVYGMGYVEKDKIKLKLEDAWKTLPAGTRAIRPHNVYFLKAKNGRKMKLDMTKSGSATLTPASGYIQMAGIVVEKVVVFGDQPNHCSNRLAVFKVNGSNLDDVETNIIEMPYSMQSVGYGVTRQDELLIMTMPVKIPTTVKKHQELRAPEGKRLDVHLYRFDTNNEYMGETVFTSPISNVEYKLISAEGEDYLIGIGNSKVKDFRTMGTSASKLNALVVAKLKPNGEVAWVKSYTDKDFEQHYGLAGSGKKKKVMAAGVYFTEVVKTDNGNLFLYGGHSTVSDYNHGILLSPEGELKQYFLFDRENLKKNAPYGHQLHVKGNKIYLLQSDQPHEMSNEVKSSTSKSSSSFTAGGYRYTTTTSTTKTTQLFEIYHLSNLFEIDASSGKCKKTPLHKAVKKTHTLGERPALFADDAIYIPGIPKGVKGKKLSMIRIDY